MTACESGMAPEIAISMPSSVTPLSSAAFVRRS